MAICTRPSPGRVCTMSAHSIFTSSWHQRQLLAQPYGSTLELNIMPKNYCCVPLCKNSTGNCPDKTHWFSFPRDHKLRKVWIQKIKRDVGKKFQITKYTTICSHHFVPFDIFPKISENHRTYLKRTAVPSIFPWAEQQSDQMQDRDYQLAMRSSIKISSQRPQNTPSAEKNETDEINVDSQNLNSSDANTNDELVSSMTNPGSSDTGREEKLELQEMENLRIENKKLHQEMEEMRSEIASLKKSNTYLKGKFLEMQKQILRYENGKNYNNLKCILSASKLLERECNQK